MRRLKQCGGHGQHWGLAAERKFGRAFGTFLQFLYLHFLLYIRQVGSGGPVEAQPYSTLDG